MFLECTKLNTLKFGAQIDCAKQ